jgi:hypothetical protein
MMMRREAMIGTRMRELSDGEELVEEGSTPERLVDPRERAIQARRRALDEEGLTPLDRDRASSIADEGGKSAAIDLDETPPFPRRPLEEK